MARNWAGTYEYRARIVEAETEHDVVRLAREGGRLHALGTRHSFTDLPDTTGVLVDVARLEGGYALGDGIVRVAAGTRYGVLATWLDEHGLALHNLGSLPHISVAGATATATHGSGDRNGVLSTAVRGIRYVGADGELHEVVRGDADFAALVVGVGAFGIVVSVDLEVQPTFRVRQDYYEGMTWDAALADLDAVTGAGYSVSVFTRWEEDSIGAVWVKTRLDDDTLAADAVPDVLRDARRVRGPGSPLGDGGNTTELGGVPGPWHMRLPHFRLDAVPSFGEEIQTEYFVAREHAPDALRALRPLGPRLRPHLMVSELRTAAADDLWLSGAYRQDVLAIHFTWYDHRDEVQALLDPIEAALAPFGARPHWGKRHAMDAAAIARVHPRLDDARAVFERLDPAGRFTNTHLERVGLRDPR